MNITTGKGGTARRIVVYGEPGVGKTRFACCDDSGQPREGVLAYEGESGAAYFGVPRQLPEDSFDKNRALLREMCAASGAWRTIVVDGADELFAMAGRELCRGRKNKDGTPFLSPADFGWNDGWHAMAARWRELLFDLESARKHDRSVILVCHTKRITEKDPTVGDFRKWTADLHEFSWGATFRWADAVLFASYERAVKDKIVSVGDRVLRTNTGPGWDAKHRPNLPDPLPLSWSAYESAVASTERTLAQVKASIAGLLERAAPEVADGARKAAGERPEDVVWLMKVEERLRSRVGPVQ